MSNLKKARELFEKLKANQVNQNIGIHEENDSREDGQSNAINRGYGNLTIGARHEHGVISESLPRRSFLEDPLLVIKKQDIIDFIKNNQDIDNLNQKTGEYCVGIVKEAFATGGFGTWRPLAKSTIEKKGHAEILLDTRQLVRSITSKDGD